MDVSQWFADNRIALLNIALIFIGAWIFKRFGEIIIQRAVKRAIKSTAHESAEAERKREETIIQIISGALHIIVWPVAVIIVISQLGIDIAPLIAITSVVGVALGFGAQSLVKDVISGMFIIAENQYRIGDVVKLQDTAGIVERITLRVTVLRDLDGIVHHIPNGTIDKTSNFSKDFSGINLNIGVAYDTNIEKAIDVINDVGAALAEEDSWKDRILEAPSFMRVDNFADSAIELKITGTVQPLAQWDVTGELRKRLKVAFDKAGIEIPFPQRVIHTSKK